MTLSGFYLRAGCQGRTDDRPITKRACVRYKSLIISFLTFRSQFALTKSLLRPACASCWNGLPNGEQQEVRWGRGRFTCVQAPSLTLGYAEHLGKSLHRCCGGISGSGAGVDEFGGCHFAKIKLYPQMRQSSPPHSPSPSTSQAQGELSASRR